MCSRMKKFSNDKRAEATNHHHRGKEVTYGLKISNNRHNNNNNNSNIIRKMRKLSMFTIINIAIIIISCHCVYVEGRIFNEAKYLEYLNDLDRRNAELTYDDIHRQWPFTAYQNTQPEDEQEDGNKNNDEISDNGSSINNDNNNKNIGNDEPEFDVDDFDANNDEIIQEQTERLNKLLSENINQKYETDIARILNKIQHGFKNVRDNTGHLSQLNQYITYNYPKGEERFQDILERTQQIGEADVALRKHHQTEDSLLPKPIIEEFNLENYKTHEIKGKNPSQPELKNDKPSHMHHWRTIGDEKYVFKDGEQFPESEIFDRIKTTNNPDDFGYGPMEPRFFLDDTGDVSAYRDIKEEQADMAVAMEPFQNVEIFPENEVAEREYPDKSVKAVPYQPDMTQPDTAGVYIIAVVAGISAAATVGLIAVGIGWYNLQKHMKNAEDTDYPSYGIVGPNKDYEKKDRDDNGGDRRLAQSAQMYHYQHQKQQIIAMGRNTHEGHASQSDTEEEEDEEGNYTVYECPGLASIEGPLEVKNPIFDDDQLAANTQASQAPSKATTNVDKP